jgi:hypothetical protein
MNQELSNRLLVRFEWDCGRMGTVEGLFVATQEELDKAYGKHVYFGEILGKHSDIDGTLTVEDITVVSEEQWFIAKLVALLGSTISGYNPLSYIEEE